jgi:hypothetical protein
MWKFAVVLLVVSPSFAETPSSAIPPTLNVEPVCLPIGQTSNHQLVYSVFCKNLPEQAERPKAQTFAVPESKVPQPPEAK